MKLLLDTNVVLAVVLEPQALSAALLRRLKVGAGVETPVFVSAASVWEIAIKKKLGKLDAPDDLPEALERVGDLALLEITASDAWATMQLRRDRRHKDPFDRLIIAQALQRDLAIATSDPAFARYGVPIVVA